MNRCHLKGAEGDAIHSVLCAAGFNIRLLLRMIRKKRHQPLFDPGKSARFDRLAGGKYANKPHRALQTRSTKCVTGLEMNISGKTKYGNGWPYIDTAVGHGCKDLISTLIKKGGIPEELNLSKSVMIVLNTAWNLVNFRSGLIKALVSHGYTVVAVAPYDQYASQLQALGCRFIPMPMDNKGTHPIRDFLLLMRLFFLMLKERPKVILGFTVKPNIYGSLAAHVLRIPVINNVAGLGTAFMKRGWLNQIVRNLYQLAFSRSVKVFFQNNDDRQMFLSGGLLSEVLADILPGSGIDLMKFQPAPLPARAMIRFLLIARMLWDKGVGEYVEAACILKARGLNVECCLLGFLDVQNPAAISRKQIDEWVSNGVVRYLGISDNVREEIANADCIVLPSFYREGTPRCLLEAAAMARPIVTTDSVGCRDVVNDGFNGYLCKPKDATDLADKMAQIVMMSPADRELMGLRGRGKVEREFDEQIVIKKYLNEIEVIFEKSSFS